MLGSRRYRFDCAPTVVQDQAPRNVTQAWQIPQPDRHSARPSLVELTPSGDGRRLPIPADEVVLGRAPGAGGVVLEDDPFAEERHARLSRDASQRWKLEGLETVNGVWVRIEQTEDHRVPWIDRWRHRRALCS